MLDRQELNKVALGMAIALLILSLLTRQTMFVVLGILFLLGLILELRLVYFLAKIWHSLFSKIVTYLSNVVLMLMYYLIYTPYGLMYQALNKKKIHCFLYGPTYESAYHTIDKKFQPKDLNNPW